MRLAVFIPGLGFNLADLSLEAYAHRLKHALDVNDTVRKHLYSIQLTKTKYGEADKNEADIATIIQHNNGNAKEVYRIYEFRYDDTLKASFENRNFFFKSFYLVTALLSNLKYLVMSFMRSAAGLNKRQKFESLYLFFIILLLSLFGLIILPSLISIMAQGLQGIMGIKDFNFGPNNSFAAIIQKLESVSHIVVALTTAAFIFAPKYQSVITGSAATYLCINNYLTEGAQKDVINGKLLALLEHISEVEADELLIEIHAYSFGSIIAIDTIFPQEKNMPEQVVKDKVQTFISIACPYDFLRVYFKHYFEGRSCDGLNIKQWLNVNAALDILSSNFRNDSAFTHGDPTLTPGNLPVTNITYNVINPKSAGFFQHLTLISLKAHKMYWSDTPDGKSFLNLVIPYMSIY